MERFVELTLIAVKGYTNNCLNRGRSELTFSNTKGAEHSETWGRGPTYTKSST